MIAVQLASLAALAIGTFASPLPAADATKPFIIGVTFPKTETLPEQTLYLTSTSTASPNKSDAIQCTIDTDKLFCGAEKKTFVYLPSHTKSPLEPVIDQSMNKAWSNVNGEIKWGAVDYTTGLIAPNVFVTFSRESKKDPNKVFAEVCSSFKHHEQEATQKMFGKGIVDFWQNGVAKAYDV